MSLRMNDTLPQCKPNRPQTAADSHVGYSKSQATPFDILEFAHATIADHLFPGDLSVDATAGNGHDTLFLSRQVGADGLVLAFDVQETALASTRKRLAKAGCPDNVHLIHQGHESLTLHLDALKNENPDVPPLRAVMFNLGYLPGSDKSLTTKPETSLSALRQALDALAPGGICSLMLYTGHAGGREEAQAVLEHVEQLDIKAFRCLRSEVCNKPGSPVISLLVWKR